MATRSAIGIVSDHFIYGVYCHWDGYPEHNGKLLFTHYNSITKVWNLIKLGNLSSLGEEIGEAHDSTDTTGKFCTYYERDMGRQPEPFGAFKSRKEFTDYFLKSGCEYFYLFEDSKWKFAEYDTPEVWNYLNLHVLSEIC